MKKYKLIPSPHLGFCYGCIFWEEGRLFECKTFNTIDKSCHKPVSSIWVINELNKNIIIL